jgi:polyisoprenoid-binding protein YceI
MDHGLAASAIALAALIAFSPAAARAAELHVDRDHSVAAFTIKHLMLSRVRGTIKIVSVDLTLKPDSAIPQTIDATLDPGSINTNESSRDRDLRFPNWFYVERYPTIRFTSTRIEPAGKPDRFRIAGTLALHGVTRDVTLDVTSLGAKRDDRGTTHYRYTATTNFDRRDFGITAYTSGAGTMLVGTGVAVTIDLDMAESGPQGSI